MTTIQFLISSLFVTNTAAFAVQHRHERSIQQQPRTVTFEVEPKTLGKTNGDHHHQHHYYFKLGTDKVNLSCTVTKPHSKYKMLLTKEQHIPGINNSKAKMELLRSGDSTVNPDLEDFTRFTTFDSDEDDTTIYRISFQISNLKLSDNGKYTCSYANIPKEVNLVVYEQLNEQDVILKIQDDKNNSIEYTDGKADFEMDKPYQFICNITEVYPKPTIEFNMNGKVLLKMDQYKHHDREILKDNFYVISSHSTVDLTVAYKNHQHIFNCIVTPGVQGVEAIVKKVSMNVKGVHIIESSCVDTVRKNEDGSVLVTCKFFGNPVPTVSWTVLQSSDEPAEETDNENADGVLETRKSVRTLEPSDEYAILMEVNILILLIFD